ncbi:hypothetical protein HYQ44_003362 [Verticillium longisporum]|nr:hypothetical protein HYQ44_003362 [Verticillium longisporum]
MSGTKGSGDQTEIGELAPPTPTPQSKACLTRYLPKNASAAISTNHIFMPRPLWIQPIEELAASFVPMCVERDGEKREWRVCVYLARDTTSALQLPLLPPLGVVCLKVWKGRHMCAGTSST